MDMNMNGITMLAWKVSYVLFVIFFDKDLNWLWHSHVEKNVRRTFLIFIIHTTCNSTNSGILSPWGVNSQSYRPTDRLNKLSTQEYRKMSMPYKTYESHLGRNTDIPVDDKWIRQVGESAKIPKNLIIK